MLMMISNVNRGSEIMTMTNNHLNELAGAANIHEYREIAVTSKRQLTIPKSFFDHLGIEDSLVAWLTDDGIYLKPARRGVEVVSDEDRRDIILGVLSEGGNPEIIADKINRRLHAHGEVMDRRIREFQDDMKKGASEDGGEDDFHGLDVFFDTEAREAD